MKKKRVETNHLIIRLCLVAVKRFPENTYFPEMLIFGKGKCFHVFGCISKKFSENIFWCLEKKKENTNQKMQIRKHKPQIQERRTTIAPTSGARPTSANKRCASDERARTTSADERCAPTSGAIDDCGAQSTIAPRDLVDRAARRRDAPLSSLSLSLSNLGSLSLSLFLEVN